MFQAFAHRRTETRRAAEPYTRVLPIVDHFRQAVSGPSTGDSTTCSGTPASVAACSKTHSMVPPGLFNPFSAGSATETKNSVEGPDRTCSSEWENSK